MSRFSTFTNRSRSALRATPAYLRRHWLLSLVGTLVLIGAFAWLATRSSDAPAAATETADRPSVTLATVATLSENGSTATFLGEVRSISQAELKAQKPGEVTRVNVRAGQTVAAGAVLVELENAAERAAVLQAQGALQGAQARLARVQAGARTEDRVSASAGADSAQTALTQAQETAQSALTGAYAAAQDALYAQADTFFDDEETVRPRLRLTSPTYDERLVLERERVELGAILEDWSMRVSQPLPASDLEQALGTASNNLDRMKAFLDRMAYFVAREDVTVDRSAATIAANTARITGARQGVEAAKASVVGATTGLAAARSAATQASLGESKLVIGERPEDIAEAQAGVTAARGTLASAVAALENTLIRSPIAGTVTSLTVSQGDFVQAQQSIAVVANERAAQEVVAFVSDVQRSELSVAQKVRVDGRFEGTVTSLDPGLDPATKRARVTVGLGTDADLVNGSFVEVALVGTSTPAQDRTRDGFLIPIEAIKVLPTGLVVFSVRDDGTLEALPIDEGTIIGDRMLVKEGLVPERMIVTDARGLVAGEQVEVRD